MRQQKSGPSRIFMQARQVGTVSKKECQKKNPARFRRRGPKVELCRRRHNLDQPARRELDDAGAVTVAPGHGCASRSGGHRVALNSEQATRSSASDMASKGAPVIEDRTTSAFA